MEDLCDADRYDLSSHTAWRTEGVQNPGSLVFSDSNRSVEKIQGGSNAIAIMGDTVMSTGVHQHRVRITAGNSCNMMIGVCTDEFTGGAVYSSDQCWVYCSFSNGQRWHNSAEEYGRSAGVGDVITVVFDADERTLRFVINDYDAGIAYSGLPTNLRLVVGLYADTDKATILD